MTTENFPVTGGAGVNSGTSVLRVRAGLGLAEAGAHPGAVRPQRAAAAGRRRVRVAGGAQARAAHAACRARRTRGAHGGHDVPHDPRAPADAPREPQRQGGRPQAAVVRLRRVRGRPPAPKETLNRPTRIFRVNVRRTILNVL